MRVAIVTDSTANLKETRAKELGVTVVPLHILFGDKSYTDGVDLSANEFYDKLLTSDRLPTTSQPSPGAFAEVYKKLLLDHDAILVITLSAKLSGTYSSAKTARDLVDGPIHIYDSQLVEYALGLEVEEAVRLAAEGMDPTVIMQKLTELRPRTRTFLVMGTLENLRRGGRIGGVAALVGSLLQVKPVLTLRDGIVDIHEKVRTTRKALEGILVELARDCEMNRVTRVTIIHSTSAAEVQAFRQQVEATVSGVTVDETWLAPIVGVHAGPGSLGMIYLCHEA